MPLQVKIKRDAHRTHHPGVSLFYLFKSGLSDDVEVCGKSVRGEGVAYATDFVHEETQDFFVPDVLQAHAHVASPSHVCGVRGLDVQSDVPAVGVGALGQLAQELREFELVIVEGVDYDSLLHGNLSRLTSTIACFQSDYILDFGPSSRDSKSVPESDLTRRWSIRSRASWTRRPRGPTR